MSFQTKTRKSLLAVSLLALPAMAAASGCNGEEGANDPAASSRTAASQKVTADVMSKLNAQNRVRVIVTLRAAADSTISIQGLQGLTEELRIDAIRQHVLGKVANLGNAVHVTHTWKHIPGFAAEVDQAGLDALAADPSVEHVQIDGKKQINLAQSLPLIKADKAHTAGHKGKGQKVVVVDTGVAANHPSLSGKVVDEACFCKGSSGGCCPNGQETQSGPGSAADDQGHGSHVSGIVAGVAPEATLVDIKVLGADGSGDDSGIVSALDWVLTNHPDAAAVNMSLGDPNVNTASDCDSSQPAYASIIDKLREKGVLTVVATGNEASSTGISAPACVKNSFSVGAVYDANVGSQFWANCTDGSTSADKITCFSNSAANLDIIAPGSVITSVNYQGGNANMSGTSQATPHVAGAVAVVRGTNTALKPADIEDILKTTGVPIKDARNSITRSRINVEAATIEAARRATTAP